MANLIQFSENFNEYFTLRKNRISVDILALNHLLLTFSLTPTNSAKICNEDDVNEALVRCPNLITRSPLFNPYRQHNVNAQIQNMMLKGSRHTASAAGLPGATPSTFAKGLGFDSSSAGGSISATVEDSATALDGS